MSLPNIVLLEDDDALRFVLQRAFSRAGHSVASAESIEQLQTVLSLHADVDLFVVDLKLQHETSLSVISQLRHDYPDAIIFMMTAYASIATTVEAIKQGADDYLPKPVSAEDILSRYQRLKTGDAQAVEELPSETLSTRRLEWEHIQRVLQENDGNISQTAKQLNMHRRTLQRKLQKKPQL